MTTITQGSTMKICEMAMNMEEIVIKMRGQTMNLKEGKYLGVTKFQISILFLAMMKKCYLTHLISWFTIQCRELSNNDFCKIRMFPTFPLDFSSGVDPSSQFQTLCLGMEDKFVTSPESRQEDQVGSSNEIWMLPCFSSIDTLKSSYIYGECTRAIDKLTLVYSLDGTKITLSSYPQVLNINQAEKSIVDPRQLSTRRIKRVKTIQTRKRKNNGN